LQKAIKESLKEHKVSPKAEMVQEDKWFPSNFDKLDEASF
jgi:hypothetical protein